MKKEEGGKEMMVYFLWIVCVGIELGLGIWSIIKKSTALKEKAKASFIFKMDS